MFELIGDPDNAIYAFEQVLRHNSWSVPAMLAISSILRGRDRFSQAVDYLQTILKVEPSNGEVWGSLGKLRMNCVLAVRTLLTEDRPLLSHDGRPTAGLFSIPASAIPPAGSQGKPHRCKAARHGQSADLMRVRNRNFGTELVSCTIVTGLSNMPRKLSRRSCAWSRTSKRQTKYTSGSE